MPLDLDIHVLAAEEADQRIDEPAHPVSLESQQFAPRKRHEPAGVALEILQRQRAFAFRRAHLHARHETAEIAIALGGLDKNRKARGAG